MTSKPATRALLAWVLLAITFATFGCAAEKQAGAKADLPEDRILILVSKAIRQAHLTDRPDECLAYRFDGSSSKEAYIVEVRENHKRASCGGDPQTQPRLFTVRVDKQSQKLSSDAGSPGKFLPLPM